MLIILLVLVCVPLAEIAAFIVIGDAIGLWPTLLTVIATAVVGSILLRQQGLMTAQKARAELAHNRMPMRSLFDGLCLFAAGLLLLTPGFITDLIGFVLFIPSIRGLLADRLVRHLEQRADVNVTLSGQWTRAPEADGRDARPDGPVDRGTDPAEPTVSGDRDSVDDPHLPPVDSSRWGRKD